MFPDRYFPARYFNNRYFPVGSETTLAVIMTIGGASWPVSRILIPERVQGGSAIRVKVVSTSDRALAGGPAIPVYYVQDSELRANGGQYEIQGNAPIPVVVVSDGRAVVGQAAVPVYVVS